MKLCPSILASSLASSVAEINMSGRTGEAALRTLITKMGGWLSGFCRTWQSRDEVVLCITVGQQDNRTAVCCSAVA